MGIHTLCVHSQGELTYGGLRLTSGVLCNGSPHYFLRHAFSLNLDLTDLVRPAASEL